MKSLPDRLYDAGQAAIADLGAYIPPEAMEAMNALLRRLVSVARESWEQTVIERLQGIARCGCHPQSCGRCQTSLWIILEIFSHVEILAATDDASPVAAGI